jgi:hypothetical protein
MQTFTYVFSFRNMKSHVVKPTECSGSNSISISKLFTASAVREGQVSWRKIHMSDQSLDEYTAINIAEV